MRYLPALALLLPMCAWAGLREFVDDGYAAQSMGADEMQLLAWYAVAICAWVSVRKLYAHKWCAGLAYACAGVAFWHLPTVAGIVLFVAVTGLILLIGLSRK